MSLKVVCLHKNSGASGGCLPKLLPVPMFTTELFDSIAPQDAEIRTVTNSSPLKFNNSAKSLFYNRLSQTDENLKYNFRIDSQ